MRLPLTLSVYIGRTFLMNILYAWLALAVLVGMADMVELIRRASSKDVSFIIVLQMMLLKLPNMSERFLPFAVLIGALIALMRLTRSHELVVARASGVSVWQFLMPAIMLAFAVGMFAITVFNPISSAMVLRFDLMEGKYITGKPSLLSVSASGLWLRQTNEEVEGAAPVGDNRIEEYIIHSLRVSQKDMSLSGVTIFAFGPHNSFIERLDAKRAVLEDGFWHLYDVIVSQPGKPGEKASEYRLRTSLTLGQIQDSFASPKTMSFWQLPRFIKMLTDAGFSGLQHRLHWHELLALPLLLCAMILIAATFSLRLPRRGGTPKLVVAGLFTGLTLYFVTDIVRALGTSGNLPIALAAWTPTIVAVMLGLAMLLHLEDG